MNTVNRVNELIDDAVARAPGFCAAARPATP
jgi:hypothetical protein